AAGEGQPLAAGSRRAAVAAALVFDTSPRMAYRQGNQTRLEQAQELAEWLLDELPPGSEVAVAQSHPGNIGFSIDTAAARRTILQLQTTGVPRPLPLVVADALELARRSPLPQKELYVLTDLSAVAWRDDLGGRLARELAAAEEVLLYVIDVGVDEPRNFGLGPLELSAEELPAGGQLRLRTELRGAGPAGSRAVALYVEEPDPSRPILLDGQPLLPARQQRGRQVVELEADGAQVVEFSLRGLPLGLHQGQVVIEGEDGLAADDVRYFAVEVQPPWPVLVVAPDDVNSTNFIEAVAPYEQRAAGQARFDCRLVTPAELPNVQLAGQRAVCLLDPTPLPPSVWEELGRFVAQGGGLAVFLGYHAGDSKSFNEPAAQQLLPGPLGRQWRSAGRDLLLAPDNYDHPVLAEFRPLASQVPWDQFPVFRHWSFEQLAADTRIVLRYGNGQPALVERSVGKGRVLTMTTPITEKARPAGRQPWNELTGPSDWPRLVLLNEMLLYLVRTETARLNYTTGATAQLVNLRERHPQRYQLFAPPDELREVRASDDLLQVRGTDVPGAYRLKGDLGGTVIRGFAVNLPGDVGNLERCGAEQLDRVLGEGRYELARERDEVEVGVGVARQGYEFFPWLLILLAVLLGVEQLLANRFYRPTPGELGSR
ncbi:MAG: hypothetical protein J5I93_17895, partial [Pirellulaceae bacterium]|nr:hypothetical protein [Pirellulaceae bacterium]